MTILNKGTIVEYMKKNMIAVGLIATTFILGGCSQNTPAVQEPQPTVSESVEQSPTPAQEPTISQEDKEYNFLEILLEVSPEQGNENIEDVMNLGYDICDSYATVGVEGTAISFSNSLETEEAADLAAKYMVASGYGLCPEYSSEIDSFIDNN